MDRKDLIGRISRARCALVELYGTEKGLAEGRRLLAEATAGSDQSFVLSSAVVQLEVAMRLALVRWNVAHGPPRVG
jgi:hypothetical protein